MDTGWHDECAVKGHGCHFNSWSNCTGYEPLLQNEHIHPRNDMSYPPDSRWRPFELMHQGTLWYRSLLIHFLLQPNADLEAKVRKYRNALGLVHPRIAVHIRAGDACAHAATSTLRPECRPIEAYITELKLMSARYNVTNVFLACDDAVGSFRFSFFGERECDSVFLSNQLLMLFDFQFPRQQPRRYRRSRD